MIYIGISLQWWEVDEDATFTACLAPVPFDHVNSSCSVCAADALTYFRELFSSKRSRTIHDQHCLGQYGVAAFHTRHTCNGQPGIAKVRLRD